MAVDDTGGTRPGTGPVMLRIKLRYEDVETMVQRFAPNVGKVGLFLPTKSLQTVGAEIKFELRLADDKPVLVGLGRVKAVKEPDPNNPKASFGMAIELMRVTPQSRELILKMLERRRQLGLPETGLPMPGDIDLARRTEIVETAVRDTNTGGGLPAPPPEPASEGLLTSPRRASGPIAIAKVHEVAALPPEAARRKRPAIQELIESASGPIVALPATDDDVDVAAVLARARALAGANLDSELEALLELSAAPVEITIEAASAELAKQLGGSAVNKRDRSARWAPPPPVSEPVAVTPPPAEPAAEPAPVAPPAELAPIVPQVETTPITVVETVPLADEARGEGYARGSSPVLFAPAGVDQIVTEPRASALDPDLLIHDDSDPDDFEDSHEVEPEQIADEIHQLTDADYEEVEHTQLGGNPLAVFEEHHRFATAPSVDEEALAQRLDAHLAEAERDDLGLEANDDSIVDPPVATTLEDGELDPVDDFEILAEADAEDADLLASHGEADASGTAAAADRADFDFAARLDLGDESDHHPRAESADFSGHHAGFDDRSGFPLDSAELAELAQSAPATERSDFDEPRFRDSVAGIDDDDENSEGYTLAGDISADALDFEPPHSGFSPPGELDLSDVIDASPTLPPRAHHEDQPPPEPEDYDLETALEALDVDLDDLSIPHAQPVLERRPPTLAPPSISDRAATMPIGSRGVRAAADLAEDAVAKGRKPRATTEDGVLIDFDEDE